MLRHDIEGGQTIHHETISDSPARCPAMKTDGTHVAFINKGGQIMVASIDGNDTHRLVDIPDDRGCLDWPEGDWIYFSHGGFSSEDSAHISRVNYKTKQRQHVATFIDPERENVLVRQWRWSISRNAKRLFTRVVDYQGDLMVIYGAYFAAVEFPNRKGLVIRLFAEKDIITRWGNAVLTTSDSCFVMFAPFYIEGYFHWIGFTAEFFLFFG